MSADPMRRRDESGMAMITVMVVTVVATMLVTAMLAQGVHLMEATARDRTWNRALQAAEAGVEQAVAMLQVDDTKTSLAGATSLGEFEVAVTIPTFGQRLITATGWSPSKTATNARSRKLQVLYAPEPVFRYALFSGSTLEIKNQNNNCTTGDAYAAGDVTIDKACVEGSVTSATGSVDFKGPAEILTRVDAESGAVVGGDVYSGGLGPSGADWGIRLNSQVHLAGSAYAQRDSCPNPNPHNLYKIVGGGVIDGDAYADSDIVSTVLGDAYEDTCQVRKGIEALPEFQPLSQLLSLYPAITTKTAADFTTWADANATQLKGIFHVDDPSGTITFANNATVTGTFVLITNALIKVPNNFTIKVADAQTEYVDIISLNASTSPAAIEVVNTFSVLPDPGGVRPPVLVYSQGLIDVKNTANSNGAFYGGKVIVKNNLNVTYDPRVKRVLGFGDQQYVRASWKEITGS